jgi:RNA polymerase sigma-70 factor, ECF subfamily
MMNTEFRHHMIAILPRLRAFAHALAKSGDVADDLVQATCEKALRACDSWTPGTRLDSWMFRIMQNQWIDMVRYRRPQVPVEGPGAPADLEGEDGERVIEARLTLRAVRRLIDELPEEQRAVLVLVCVEGMSYREAAEVTGVPVGTVMSRLARARRSLHVAAFGELAVPTRAAGEDR